MATEADEPGPVRFDPFSAAEVACEEAIDAILTEGGRLLYESYLERKSFSFASTAVSQVLVSELKMCFVRCDGGERQEEGPSEEATGSPAPPASPVVRDGWALEAEPARCRIDTWARACVPVRKKLVRPKVPSAKEEPLRSRVQLRNTKASTASNASVGRSPSRAGAPGMEQTEARGATSPRQQMIPLVEEHEEDEEESVMRDMKEREARRKREEETRLQRKAAEEADEAARLAQVKDQMKNKPFTYDSNGSIIWVQPLRTDKLPNTNPAPTYNFKKEASQQAADHAGSSSRPALVRGPTRRRLDKKREGEFTDSFKKFAAQQPAMMEAMTMAPGVELSERGRKKQGPEQEKSHSGPPTTRKDYEAMVESGTRFARHSPERMAAEVQQQQQQRSASAAPSEEKVQEGVASTASAGQEGAPRKVEAGAPGTLQPPNALRPVPPKAPPPRRVQLKRGALAEPARTRERVDKGIGSRFPSCAAPPPLGATMGHGLVGQRREEYYFPNGAGPEGSSLGEVSNTPLSARAAEGHIVSSNPELAKRLFLQH